VDIMDCPVTFVRVFAPRSADGIVQSRGVEVKRLATRGALAVLPVRLLPFGLISLNISVAGASVCDNRM